VSVVTKRRTYEDVPTVWRIGELAKLTGVTTRTLRYWEELGLIHPASVGAGGERYFEDVHVARVARIRNLQELLGFSLSEVRAVLDAEDVDILDRVRSKLGSTGLSSSERRDLLQEGIEANDALLARLEETLARIEAFREERVAARAKLYNALRALDSGAEDTA
jgi:DNA-binding transcriptional MerR regulator